MDLSQQLAKHFRDVHFGGNWTCVNLKDTLSDINWKQATTKVQDFNTIATLAFHVGYFVDVVLQVFEGGQLDGNDKLSFDHPPINCESDWQNMLEDQWTSAERLASLIADFPVNQWFDVFVDEKYDNYFRNVQGMVEHSHYHLGQIVLIKRMLKAEGVY